jgi:hypothetical protein
MTDVSVSLRSAAIALAAFHTWSGMRTLWLGVSPVAGLGIP